MRAQAFDCESVFGCGIWYRWFTLWFLTVGLELHVKYTQVGETGKKSGNEALYVGWEEAAKEARMGGGPPHTSCVQNHVP